LPPYFCFDRYLVLGSVSIAGRRLCVKENRPQYGTVAHEGFRCWYVHPKYPLNIFYVRTMWGTPHLLGENANIINVFQ